MFDFFKRSSGKPVVEQSVRPKRTPAASKPFGSLEPLPLPQVAEGNTDAEWSAWEDSVAFQDSQISSFGASSFGAATRPPDLHPGDTVPDDPFSKVHKHAP